MISISLLVAGFVAGAVTGFAGCIRFLSYEYVAERGGRVIARPRHAISDKAL